MHLLLDVKNPGMSGPVHLRSFCLLGTYACFQYIPASGSVHGASMITIFAEILHCKTSLMFGDRYLGLMSFVFRVRT